MHNYRILKGFEAQNEVLTSGTERVFHTFELSIPEKPVDGNCDAGEEAKIEDINPLPEKKEPTPEELVMQNAVTKAEKLLDLAREEAEEIRHLAHRKGYEEGYKEGKDEGRLEAMREEEKVVRENFKNLQEKINWYVSDMENCKQKILEEYMDDLKNISLAIGEKIVQTSLKSSSDVVKKMILSATEKLKKTAWAKIYVSVTGDETEIKGDKQLLAELSKLSDNVKIVVMEDGEPGTCIVELPHEIIDISVGTQMENIRDILNNARL